MADIRLSTGLIIKRNNEYLVGICMVTNEPRWSISPWDAWITRIRAEAKWVSEKMNGEIYLFNPVVGQTRKYCEVK